MKMSAVKQIIAACLFLITAGTGFGQNIILDKPTKAAELTLYPDRDDPKSYYYLVDKPKIATGANGQPEFSFLRYVDNTATGDEGEGGGIVHAIVELQVSEEQRREAETALQGIESGAKLIGPVAYKDGSIALISSTMQPNGEFAKQVIGIGKAPLLDGHKAAVSVQLTKLGAKVLHASFQTPTPDMTFAFEMSISGYRLPKKAIIEANFDMVYEHKAFRAAVAAPVLQAEINMAFDDLVKSGAIKVINKGADEQMEKLIEDAYNKLTRLMFEPTAGTGTPSLEQLAGSTGGQSMMDRATNLLNASRTEAKANNAAIREENRRLAEASATASAREDAPVVAPAGSSDSTATRSAGSGEVGPRSYYAQTGSREPSNHARSGDGPSTPQPRQEEAVPQL
ncbi:MAG TPA: hypothetical protein VIH22_07380, partial [Cyclobacteriaceae bacterium]